jgi:CBS domain-containing protein
MKVSDIMITKDLVTVSNTESVGEALSRMRDTGVHQIPVLSGKRYLGMLSYREILRRRSIFPASKVETVMIKTPKLSPGDNINSAIRLFREAGVPALPVVQKGLLVGLLSRTDILKNISSIVKPGQLRVSEIMSDDPITAREDENLEQAIEKIRGLDETEIPVSDGNGKLTGILRIDELSGDAIMPGKEGHGRRDWISNPEKNDIKVASIMSQPVSVKPTASVEDLTSIMVSNGLHVVPIVDGSDRIVGVVDVYDVINAMDVGRSRAGVLVQVSGLGPYDDDLYDIIYFEAGKFLSKLGKMSGVKSGTFNVHVAKYHSEGRIKYSVRTKLFAGSLNMSVSDYDWNFGKCIAKIFETYENLLKKDKAKQ